MKYLNLNTKQHNFFVKGMAALSLSIALQAFRACNTGGTQDHAVTHQNDNQFSDDLDNKRDISKPDETGKDCLHVAVEHNMLQKVVIILNRINQDKESGFKYENDFPNAFNKSGNNKSQKTALCIAIEKGFIEIVKRLVQNKHIDINKAKKGFTSLLVALKNKKRAIAEILLKLPDIDITTKDSISWSTPLHLAIEHRFDEVVKSLVEQLAKKDLKLLSEKDKNQRTSLHVAIEKRADDLAKLLVNKLPIERLSAKDKDQNTPLHVAIEKDNMNLVKLLVNKLPIEGLSAKDNKERTPLHMATRSNNREAFKLLYEQICKLYDNKQDATPKLFDKNRDGYSVIARAYLPKYKMTGKLIHSNDNDEMFQYILNIVKEDLDAKQWALISNEINTMKYNGTINEKHADTLQKIVSETKPNHRT